MCSGGPTGPQGGHPARSKVGVCVCVLRRSLIFCHQGYSFYIIPHQNKFTCNVSAGNILVWQATTPKSLPPEKKRSQKKRKTFRNHLFQHPGDSPVKPDSHPCTTLFTQITTLIIENLFTFPRKRKAEDACGWGEGRGPTTHLCGSLF